MAIPFKGDYPFLRKHSEDEYLKLENMFNNLLIAVESLKVVYENEHNRDTIKLGALAHSIERILPEYQEFRGNLTFQGKSSLKDSATTKESPYAFRVNKEEHSMILESLEHLAIMLGKKDKDYNKYINLKNELEVKNASEEIS